MKVVLETPGLVTCWSHIEMNRMVPEIHIIDENPPIFDLEWMDQCADKVTRFRFKKISTIKNS